MLSHTPSYPWKDRARLCRTLQTPSLSPNWGVYQGSTHADPAPTRRTTIARTEPKGGVTHPTDPRKGPVVVADCGLRTELSEYLLGDWWRVEGDGGPCNFSGTSSPKRSKLGGLYPSTADSEFSTPFHTCGFSCGYLHVQKMSARLASTSEASEGGGFCQLPYNTCRFYCGSLHVQADQKGCEVRLNERGQHGRKQLS